MDYASSRSVGLGTWSYPNGSWLLAHSMQVRSTETVVIAFLADGFLHRNRFHTLMKCIQESINRGRQHEPASPPRTSDIEGDPSCPETPSRAAPSNGTSSRCQSRPAHESREDSGKNNGKSKSKSKSKKRKRSATLNGSGTESQQEKNQVETPTGARTSGIEVSSLKTVKKTFIKTGNDASEAARRNQASPSSNAAHTACHTSREDYPPARGGRPTIPPTRQSQLQSLS